MLERAATRDMVDIERLLSSPGVDLDRARLHFRLFEARSAASSKESARSGGLGPRSSAEVVRTPWQGDFRL
jgi:hypothetical protein